MAVTVVTVEACDNVSQTTETEGVANNSGVASQQATLFIGVWQPKGWILNLIKHIKTKLR
jgi:hypothetical protein